MIEMDEQTIIQQLASVKEGDIVGEQDFFAINAAKTLLITYREMEAYVCAASFSEDLDELEDSEIRYEAKEETITIPLGLAERLYEESKGFNIIYAMAKYNQEKKIPTLIVTCDPEEQESMWKSRLRESYGKCACITLSDVSLEAFSELERYMEA